MVIRYLIFFFFYARRSMFHIFSRSFQHFHEFTDFIVHKIIKLCVQLQSWQALLTGRELWSQEWTLIRSKWENVMKMRIVRVESVMTVMMVSIRVTVLGMNIWMLYIQLLSCAGVYIPHIFSMSGVQSLSPLLYSLFKIQTTSK